MKKSLTKLPTLDEIRTAKAEKSLSEYIKQAWPVLEPGIDYVHNWHIDAMAEYLEAVKLGQIKRLIINVPPRHMKSIAVTVMFPTWIWIDDAFKRIISVSYSATLSKKHNINKRDIITSPWYQNKWGDKYSLKSDKNTQINFENDKKGFMFATSIGGTLTGEGGDIIIIDDPHNPKQAESDAERNSALNFCKSTLPTRLNDKKKGAIIVVMQRLHQEDVSGHFLAQGGWEHLCLQGEAEKKTIINFPISLKQIIRNEGDLLWPEREGHTEIEDMKKTLGSYGFAGQYQQRPSPAEGGMVKRAWWKYYKILPQIAYKIISVDATFKDNKNNDFVSIQVWGKTNANMYLIDRVKARMDFPTTIQAIKNVKAKHNDVNAIYIEDKANGSAIIQTLRTSINGIIPVEPSGSKEARVSAISPQIEAGNVYIPENAEWVCDYVEEWAAFPNAAHDDDVDGGSQAILKLKDVLAKIEVHVRDEDNLTFDEQVEEMCKCT